MEPVFQLNQMDCGPACLATISLYYKKDIDLGYIREKCFVEKDGVSVWGLSRAAKHIGFDVAAVRSDLHTLKKRPFALYFALEQESFCCALRYKKGLVDWKKALQNCRSGIWNLHIR